MNCIFTKTDDAGEHLAKVEAVLASLAEHELLAKGKKCEFFRSEMEFLGFMVSADGVAPVPGKVEAIRQVPPPETVSQLRSFLGMANFFRSHLPAFSEVSAPLTDLLRHTTGGRQRLQWTLECDQAFQLVKDMLTSAPLLRHFDPGLRTAAAVSNRSSPKTRRRSGSCRATSPATSWHPTCGSTPIRSRCSTRTRRFRCRG